MEIKAIEVMGNLIILEKVIGVSAIRTVKNGLSDRTNFVISYLSDKTIEISEDKTPLFADFGEIIVCHTDTPLEELRNKIISIIKEK